MIRSTLLVITGLLNTFIMGSMALVARTEGTVYRIARLWSKIMLAVSGVKVDIIGLENIIKDKPQIVMANHQGVFDVFLPAAFIPVQFNWIAKKELFAIPIFGTAMKKAGNIPIDRNNLTSAIKSLDEAARRVKNGKSLMTFPEGTRSRNGEIRPFKKGIFYIAIKSGVPIIPMTIVGSREIMPRRSLRINPGRIKIIIDKPIDVKPYNLETRDDLIKKVRDVIVKNHKEVKAT